jgi:hypothetical protein
MGEWREFSSACTVIVNKSGSLVQGEHITWLREARNVKEFLWGYLLDSGHLKTHD